MLHKASLLTQVNIWVLLWNKGIIKNIKYGKKINNNNFVAKKQLKCKMKLYKKLEELAYMQ